MPYALYLLALAVFAQGTSEFMLSGLIPAIATDLHVSVAAAGSLTSVFAVGMIAGAPLMAALGRRWPRRRALLVFLVAFLLAHVAGAVTTTLPVLLATRLAAAVANAGFLAVALSAATAMVRPDRRARATAVLLGGVTLACIVGVPAGALLGQYLGWRSVFWAVAALSVPALVGLRSVPAAAPDPAAAGVRTELRALRDPRLARTLALAALVNGATFGTYTYLAPVVTGVAGLAPGWVPAVLALFGLGSFAGVTIAGRVTAPLAPACAVLLGGWLLLALTAGAPAALLALVPVQATLSFAVGATLIARVLRAATTAPTMAGGYATAALNLGAAAGPWLGGAALAVGLGPHAPLWTSTALAALALALAVRRRADA